MPEQTDQPSVPVEDMVSVHGVFREACAAAPDLIASADGDAERVQLVSDYYANVLAFLHAHHEGEDAVITPRLLERSSEHDLINHLAGQHQAVLPLLDSAEGALHAWHDGPTDETAAQLTSALDALAATLIDHLDQEEAGLLPICSQHLTLEEWGQMPGHTLMIFTGDRVWLILGLIREQMSEQQKATMLANMPPPAVEMWTTMGNAAFDEFVGTLRAA